MFDLAADLRQGFFATHGEHRMPKSDKENDQGYMAGPGSVEPAQGLLGQCHHPGLERARRQGSWRMQKREGTPNNQHYYHRGGDGHDL